MKKTYLALIVFLVVSVTSVALAQVVKPQVEPQVKP